MAHRPVFIPNFKDGSLVHEMDVHFRWHSGMAPVQKRKNIMELHGSAAKSGLRNLLEVSSKSELEIGRRLSAFSLKIDIMGEEQSLESVYQGSKRFRNCGPFPEAYSLPPRDAKKYVRAAGSDELIGFRLGSIDFPLYPKNAFYDWLYINALYPHRDWIDGRLDFDGYTDIEFNPRWSINCQARALAEFLALHNRRLLGKVCDDFNYFVSLLSPI